MRTVTVRELRNDFAKLSTWLSAGEEIEITKRGITCAKLVPVELKKAGQVKRPDFAGRLRQIYGDRKAAQNAILLEREEAKW